jgi:hypothetical protein
MAMLAMPMAGRDHGSSPAAPNGRATAANDYVVNCIVTGTIDPAGITGEPLRSLRFGDEELPDPQLSDVIAGLQVTASLAGVADLFERELTLPVPVVNTASEAVPFVGVAMVTTTKTSIGRPTVGCRPAAALRDLPPWAASPRSSSPDGFAWHCYIEPSSGSATARLAGRSISTAPLFCCDSVTAASPLPFVCLL